MPKIENEIFQKAPNFFNVIGNEQRISFSSDFEPIERCGMGTSELFHRGESYRVFLDGKQIGIIEIYENPPALLFEGEVTNEIRKIHEKNRKRYERKINTQEMIIVFTPDGRQDGWEHIPFP